MQSSCESSKCCGGANDCGSGSNQATTISPPKSGCGCANTISKDEDT